MGHRMPNWPRGPKIRERPSRTAADPRARDADGRRTTFYTVHVVLIALALVLAAASAVTALVILL